MSLVSVCGVQDELQQASEQLEDELRQKEREMEDMQRYLVTQLSVLL